MHQIAAGVKFAEARMGKVILFAHIVDHSLNPDRRGFFREIDLVSLFPGVDICETNTIETLVLRGLNSRKFHIFKKIIVDEENFLMQKKFLIAILKGWFQSFDYMPAKMNFKTLKSVANSNPGKITVHIRLTDFLTIDTNPLNSTYYQTALSILDIRRDVDDIRCFSDDIQGAKSILPPGYHYNFPEINAPITAPKLLADLANSTKLVCSKSSLCWWAANCVSESGGLVVSPWEGSVHSSSWISTNQSNL